MLRLFETLKRKGAVDVPSADYLKQISRKRVRARCNRWKRKVTEDQQTGKYAANGMIAEQRLANWKEMTEEERDDWPDEEFKKNQAEEGEVTGVLNWKVAKKKSGAQKTKIKRANKKKREEETAAAAHQGAMAGFEDTDTPATAPTLASSKIWEVV